MRHVSRGDDDLPGADFERFIANGECCLSFLNDEDFLVRVGMQFGANTGLSFNDDEGDAGVAVIESGEFGADRVGGEVRFVEDEWHVDSGS